MNGVDRRVQEMKVAGRSAPVWCSGRQDDRHSIRVAQCPPLNGCNVAPSAASDFDRPPIVACICHCGLSNPWVADFPGHLPSVVQPLGCSGVLPASIEKIGTTHSFFRPGSQLSRGTSAMVDLTSPAAAKTQYWPIFPWPFSLPFIARAPTAWQTVSVCNLKDVILANHLADASINLRVRSRET